MESCGRPHVARGWCAAHYTRWRQRGSVEADRPVQAKAAYAKTAKARFAQRYWMDPKTGCWLWTGYVGEDGYGQFSVNGKGRRAHRVSYELHVGPIPEGMTLDHRCHNSDDSCPGGVCTHRRCVNPGHLEVVTNVENVMRGKGFAAEEARQTHCKYGHEFTPENTYVYRKMRYCRTCKRRLDAEYRARKAGRVPRS